MKLTDPDKRIRNEIITIIPLFLLSIIIPVGAWYGLLQHDEKIEIWFQRSGSISVLFAVWVEFKLFTISNFASPVSAKGLTMADTIEGGRLKLKYGTAITKLKYLAAVYSFNWHLNLGLRRYY